MTKKTINKKINTISLSGKDYAQVKDRVIEFRNENPRGLIETFPTVQPDGIIIFKAKILKDKSDNTSAEATGHAMGTNKGVKAFEKLESIAVGRALAFLGYGTDGAIASSEEMEEFEKYKKTKTEEHLMLLKENIDSINSLEELRAFYKENKGLGAEIEQHITNRANTLKTIQKTILEIAQ